MLVLYIIRFKLIYLYRMGSCAPGMSAWCKHIGISHLAFRPDERPMLPA